MSHQIPLQKIEKHRQHAILKIFPHPSLMLLLHHLSFPTCCNRYSHFSTPLSYCLLVPSCDVIWAGEQSVATTHSAGFPPIASLLSEQLTRFSCVDCNEIMSSPEKKRRKKTMEMNISWNNKKAAADGEEPLLQQEVDELLSWVPSINRRTQNLELLILPISAVNTFECMDDVQLRKCFRNPHSSQKSQEKPSRTKQVHKSNVRSNLLQVQKKCSSSIMAAVWKFHSEEEEHSITTSII